MLEKAKVKEISLFPLKCLSLSMMGFYFVDPVGLKLLSYLPASDLKMQDKLSFNSAHIIFLEGKKGLVLNKP